ncbi:MAG TPA: ABC transporter permease [Myxococcota bacterium]|nr:ABC transporter permease [Myxococcota bacterium]
MDAPTLLLVASTVRFATPLALAALGELVAERAGVLNIGIEGMMLAGALAAYELGVASGSSLVALGGAIAAACALALVFAAFALRRQADPIVSGTALNILALGATGSLFRLLNPAGAALARAPRVGELLPGLNGFTAAALLLVAAVALFLGRTRLGLALRAVGERAEAADAQGVSVARLRLGATLFGGACAGVAGAALVLWLSDVFVEGMTSGRGFIALALVLFGGYRPLRIVAGTVLFGAASALQFRLQAAGSSVPYTLLLMTPYVLTLLVLALFAGRSRAPADLARPFHARD